ncbi:peptidase S1 [Clostridiales bacterium PH28_bin88]|nr:peptidase S1 [Clostridiales bacterium PH28_bin88]
MERSLHRTLVMAVVAAFVLGVVLAGGVFYISGFDAKAAPAPEGTATQTPAANAVYNQEQVAALVPPGMGPDTIADMVAKAGPAVVKVVAYSESQRGNVHDPFLNDPFFRQFFGDRIPFDTQPRVTQGMGSGFIITPDGYILTNEHVVNGASKIEVVISGKENPFPAELIGSDFDLDLAVLKIKAGEQLPTLELGDSDQIRVGNWVIAIGNPMGMDHTVTVGVVSYKGREVDVEERHFKSLLQTDASINPGNSGGPLLNLEGKVIGINNAINAQAQGIGFAIPSNTVKSVLKDLMEKGRVIRPWLGVGIQEVTDELAQYFGLNKAEGAIISNVVSGSPADKAGLRRGDVVLEFAGKSIKNPDDLVEAIQGTPIGKKVVALVFRDKQTQYVTIVIGEKGKTD